MKANSKLTNSNLAELLRDVAAAYQIKDSVKNKFKIVAYERAADGIEHSSTEMKDVWEDNKLTEVPGVGPSIAQHLDELFKTGRSKHFDEVLGEFKPSMFELMKVQGIGPKTAYRLVTELKVSDKSPFDDVEKLAKSGKIAGLEGFGKQSEEDILKGILEYKNKKPTRLLISYAEEIANEIIEYMKKDSNVIQIEALGSLRRKAATIGDIDLAAACKNQVKVIERFVNYPKATRVLEKGDHSASFLLPANIRVDIMVTSNKNFGSVLQHFTGSKHHNVALREYAIKKGLSVSDYGITKGKKLLEFDSEQKFYNFLGMEWIPPEIREDQGEIQKALSRALPKLLDLKDIKGDLQIHSDFDIETSHDVGESSMEEIIEKGNELGYEYLAFTEHNPSKSKHNEKEIIDLLKRKKEKIEKINYSLSKNNRNSIKKVFNSLEIDIMPGGLLPVPEEGLNLLDFALVSIHSSFDLDRTKMTKRVLNAFQNPKVKIFAHPSGRLLNKRESVSLDWEKVFEEAIKRNIWIEINAEPSRLDLPDVLVHDALKKGILFTMGTDSHHKDGLYNMKYGVYVARRGWCEAKNIVNTRSLKDFESML